MALASLLVVASAHGCDWVEGSGGRSLVRAAGDAQTLLVGRPADVIGLDPARRSDNESIEVTEQVFEHLVRFKRDSNEIEPDLATHWEVADSGRQWTFHLRDGVRFHDGTALDADAVVFSFERQMREDHPYFSPDYSYWHSTYANILRIEKLDRLTVRLEIEKGYAPFLANLAMFPASIVSPSAMKRLGLAGFERAPVGTGPFRFVTWLPGDRVVLERNDNYWGGAPLLKRLVFRVLPDPRQRLKALESGALDVAYNILPEELQFVSLHPDLRLLHIPGNNVAYLAMNTQHPPFDDVVVRRAVNRAIHKNPIVRLIYQGNGRIAYGPLPPGMLGDRGAVEDYPYDPARAAAELASVNFDFSKHFRLYVMNTPRPYLPNPTQVARVMRRQLAEIGVQLDIVENNMEEHLRATQNGEHDLCLLGWSGDTGDPDNFMYVLLSSANAVPGSARNVAFLQNPGLDGLLTWAQTTNVLEERAGYYRLAQEIVAREAPWVPLAHSEVAIATRNDVEGVKLHPSTIVYYRDVWLNR